jgi:hypothetical protein
VTKLRVARRDTAMPPAKSIWLKITPPKIVPRALVSRGNMVTRRVGSLATDTYDLINERGKTIQLKICKFQTGKSQLAYFSEALPLMTSKKAF